MSIIKHKLASLRSAVSQTHTATSATAKHAYSNGRRDRTTHQISSPTIKDQRPDWYQAIHGSDS